ncbi:hypothetical protein [Chamaesiphon sp. VAR_48_metabat_135_sub]|uniref:hypothetical protein n=1 Tax=Chamaesiphon sp. VAR_48_metabat_135_sub TaxID=2964699 RepID=UPI00286D5762|nr:hypothetical protein [Chamaesiphon sp. VAR_48_metabat_135_sub]
MQIGNYLAEIQPGTEDDRGYVAIKMTEGKAPFTLKLNNYSDRKSKVNIHIHGLDQGTWVLMPHQVSILERPVHIAEKFCAYAVGSEGGNAIGLTTGDPNNGLISITFMPEKRIVRPASIVPPSAMMSKQSRASFSEAGVGTEGESHQTFQTVKDFETDVNETVTINLRIVELKNSPRPLSSALSNPVPPAI